MNHIKYSPLRFFMHLFLGMIWSCPYLKCYGQNNSINSSPTKQQASPRVLADCIKWCYSSLSIFKHSGLTICIIQNLRG